MPPIRPWSAVSEVSAIPATAVGNANGSSIIPSKTLLNGKSYLTRTQARITPITAFIADAMKAVKKLTLKLARTLGFVITSIISPKLKLAVNTINDANGIITIILNIVRVTPIESPKPGITLLFLLLILHHLFFLINFIKHSTIGKMLFLYGVPTTEILYCN